MKKIIITFLLVVAPLALSFVFKSDSPYQEQEKQPETNQPETTENKLLAINQITKDWQEYNNQTYGYTIKFPQDWQSNQTYPNPNIPVHVVFSSVSEDQRNDQPYAIFAISIEAAKDRNLDGYYVIGDLVMDGYEKNSLEISNTQGSLLITSDDHKDLGNIVILRDGYFYRLTWNATTRKLRQQYEEIFKQIIATFKFTNLPVIDQKWI